MSRTATLAVLSSDVRQQADIVGATLRHTDASLNRLINQGIQRFRERLSTEGAAHFLTSASGTLTIGATSPYPFQTLDLSSVSPSVVRTYSVQITFNSQTRQLLHVPWNSTADYGGPQYTGMPAAWAHFQTRKIALMPAPDAAYTYLVWYLPVLADLATDSDTFDGVAGWEDFITWDVVKRIIVRDQAPQAFAMAEQFANELWTDILRNATKVSHAGGSTVGRDTMGQRIHSMRRNKLLPRP